MLVNVKNHQIIFDFNVYFSVRKTAIRKGLCSRNYNDDSHCLLWDFDDVPYISIQHDLQYLQREYFLPTIYVLESSENHYHAYCFCKRSFREIMHILSDTSTIDIDYLRLGVARGYYTLRYSPKKDSNIKIHAILKSPYHIEMSPLDIIVNEYYTGNL